MEIVVFGAGSLGSLVGGILADEHDVTLVGRNPHVDIINESGLQLSGGEFGSTIVDPRGSTTVPPTAELAIVTVKSFDTDQAARALRECNLDAVVSLQNGMGNESILGDALDCPVLAGTCTYGARLLEAGHVECTGIGEVAIGHPDGGSDPFVERFVGALTDGGLVVEGANDMPRRLWEKLAVNAGINATTALARVKNGALVAGPAAKTARQAARETAQVAVDAGVSLDETDAVARMRTVAQATADNTSSMLQDIQSGNRTEIDAINGFVVEQATRPVPVNQTLTALIRGWESSSGIRGAGTRSK